MPDNPPLFVMAGGGTGGHVIPAIAVARQLVSAGCRVAFVGTGRGAEARLVPAAGFTLEKINAGGLKNLGLVTRLTSVWQLLVATRSQWSWLGQMQPAAVFSMGGYVAGPPVLAALFRRIPIVIMEPNAVPGATNRWISRWVRRALVSFDETVRYFPPERTELTGLPVRDEFFAIRPKAYAGTLDILITGGSQGSRTLNEAARASWPLFTAAKLPVRITLQTGTTMHTELANDFAAAGVEGSVSEFIADMPAAFRAADLIICRAGAGAVAELAAAGKPAVLIPFPFAADDHQLKNAQAFERAGAAVLSLDKEWTGQKLFDLACEFLANPQRLAAMGESARRLARPGAAQRAAQILLEEGKVGPEYRLTATSCDRNNR
ncbi:MAG: UDP-N-acetylglucosamine--N-acetylmuramyl-(pentapeptide) pyrophosphoryl-undecaprenol [Bryobacterales bacterium]|jgi:UDP-N-acetylglucosamine--N-acetylmuramyl-(pentapeptide) pyrophosphoryl-undecaprenol N-acetylglucosamine transferase|nr:UDP-N-acetylglucosamine--N-acetylmuramyl-(pentapeptide) pyrophosphoryl-undecaprenol [Bryobacterales bacterium]